MTIFDKTPVTTHRSGSSAVDSGVDPTAWTDNPSAITEMISANILRVYPRVTAGSITSYTIRILGFNASNTFLSAVFTKSADITEAVDFEGYAGENRLYVRIDTLVGGGTLALDYSAIRSV